MNRKKKKKTEKHKLTNIRKRRDKKISKNKSKTKNIKTLNIYGLMLLVFLFFHLKSLTCKSYLAKLIIIVIIKQDWNRTKQSINDYSINQLKQNKIGNT